MKTCPDCEQEKEKNEVNFYKAGKSWQRRCKPCHNANRKRYALKTFYKKKGTGFARLPDENQKAIMLALHNGDTYIKIASDNNLKYSTFCSWRRKGLIPEYEVPQE